MDIVRIGSLYEIFELQNRYLAKVKLDSDFWFRGQADCEWILLPTLARLAKQKQLSRAKILKLENNIAMLFASTYENGKPEMKGLCLNCAKKMNIPGIDDLIKQTGMSEEELSAITDQMNDSMSMFDEDSEMDFLSNFKDADKEDEVQIEENEEAEAHQDEVEDKEPSKKRKKKKK